MRDAYWLFGTRLLILADRIQTEGRYDLIEGYFPAGTQTPPHLHRSYSELVHAVEGEFTVWTPGGKTVLRPGDSFMIPTGVPHVVATLAGPARGFVVASPSGFASLITRVATKDDGSGVPPSNPPDMEAFLRVSAEAGDELLGPPGTLLE